MNSIILTAVVFLVAICSFSFAQDDYNPEFLIPYNDHGRWGYSDTLGEVKVEAQFSSVDFFTKRSNLGIASVEIESVQYVYIANYGLSAPVGFETTEFYDRDLLLNNISIVTSPQGKIEIFDYSKQKLITNVNADEYVVSVENNAIYLQVDERIYEFSMDSRELTKLPFVVIQIFAESPFNDDCDCTTYLIDRRGNWHIKLEGKWVSLGKEPDLSSESKPSNLRTSRGKMPQKEKVFGEVYSFSRFKYSGATYYSSIETLDGSEYQVMRTKDGFGVVLEGESYLPFQYDFIDINYERGYFILIKDKKMGVHLPNTIYSTIEPKYDLLTLDRTIKVNPKWNFVIYEVRIGEDVVYVGENGVEYFNFD